MSNKLMDELIPDEALGQARADGATLDDLLAGKN